MVKKFQKNWFSSKKFQAQMKETTFVRKFDDVWKRQIRRRSRTMKICLIIKIVSWKKSFFIKKNRLWFWNFDHLKLNVIQQIHVSITIKHFDYIRISRFINQCYYWLCINRMIKRYVYNCYSCCRVKTSHDKFNEKINFLFIFKRN